jgi:hypothetical protein
MADIFISYASVDRPTAHRLAEALEARSWSVWWDYRGLRGGQNFDRIIEKEISTARVVIVIWSQNSVESDWVRAEAAQALHEKKLVPLRIDSAAPPLRFRNIHTVDLSSWTEQTEAEPFERLIETLSYYLGPSNSSNRSEQPGTRTKPSSQADSTDDARRFSVGGNQQSAETVPSVGHPRTSPNSGSFHTSVAIEHSASTAGPTSLAGRKRVGKYFNVVVVTGAVLLSMALVGRQHAPPIKPFTEATVPKPPTSTGNAVVVQANQGNAIAQTNLGVLYRDGKGVPQDYAEALRWYRKAADQGNAIAQTNLGMCAHSLWLPKVSSALMAARPRAAGGRAWPVRLRRLARR